MDQPHRTLILWPLLGLACASSVATAAKLNVIGAQSGTVNESIELATVKYDVTAKRVVATTTAGNFVCPQGAAASAGQVGLTIDGTSYGVLSDPPGTQAAPVQYAPGSKEFSLAVSGSELCKSSDVTATGLTLHLNEEGPFTVAENPYYQVTPRRLDVRVVEPVLCHSYAAAGTGLTIRLTDASGIATDYAGFETIDYLLPQTSELRATSQLDPQTQGRVAQCYGFAAGGSEGAITPSGDSIFNASFEYSDLQADLVVTTSTQQANVLADGTARNVSYKITVHNIGNGSAGGVRLGEYVPVVAGTTVARGTWSCLRYINSEDINPTACGSGAAGALFAPSNLTLAGGEILEFVLNRTITGGAETVNTPLTFGVAAFVAPTSVDAAARPERDYSDNSDPITFTLVGNQPPQVSAPLAASTTEDGAPITLVYAPTDPESDPITLTTVTTNNAGLFTEPFSIVAGPNPGEWTVTLTPAADRNGTATVSATFSDGTTNTVITSPATVTSVNDAPTFALAVAGSAITVTEGGTGCSGSTCTASASSFVGSLLPGPASATDETTQTVRPNTVADAFGDQRLIAGACRPAAVDGVDPAVFFADGSLPRVNEPSAGVFNLVAALSRTVGAVECDVTVIDNGSPAATSEAQVITLRYQVPAS
jgi:hypothetical protein